MNYEINVIFSCGVNAFLPAVDVWLVVDVLRATTVITRWFELGGSELFPVKNPDEAKILTQNLKTSGSLPLLMGEVNGIPPEGFELGNSPLDLNNENVKNHSCAVMSTTNGTVALLEAYSTGSPVLAVSFRNSSAVLDYALSFGHKIGILCAGRRKNPGWDDIFCAGAIIKRLQALSNEKILMTDSAKICLLVWETGLNDIQTCIKRSEHATYLERIGYGSDIEFACQYDVSTVVPMLFTDENGRNFLKSVSGSSAPYKKNQVIKSQTQDLKFEELLQYTKSNTKLENYFFINKNSNKKGS